MVELTIRIDWLATLEGVPVTLRSPASVTVPGTVSRVTVVPVFMFTVMDEPDPRLKLAEERAAVPVKTSEPEPLTFTAPVA